MCTRFPAKKRQVSRSARNTKSCSGTYQKTFVVTEESNKGHFAVRNTSPITHNVKWYIYVPKSYKGLKNEPFVQAYQCVPFGHWLCSYRSVDNSYAVCIFMPHSFPLSFLAAVFHRCVVVPGRTILFCCFIIMFYFLSFPSITECWCQVVITVAVVYLGP